MLKDGRTDDAALAAECGRALSPFERVLYDHYLHLECLERYYMNAETKSKYLELKRKEEAYLCSVFLEAIRKKNGQKILDIAQAVWFLNGVFGKIADKERAHLLSLKGYFDTHGIKWTIQQIAHSLQQSKGLPIEDHNKDGFSALRRKCKKLGVPIAKSRRGRRKKTQ